MSGSFCGITSQLSSTWSYWRMVLVNRSLVCGMPCIIVYHKLRLAFNKQLKILFCHDGPITEYLLSGWQFNNCLLAFKICHERSTVTETKVDKHNLSTYCKTEIEEFYYLMCGIPGSRASAQDEEPAVVVVIHHGCQTYTRTR
jgi:hypothetical protein